MLYETGRATYATATDEEAIAAFHLLCQKEGIIPALESSHALAYLITILFCKKGSFILKR